MLKPHKLMRCTATCYKHFIKNICFWVCLLSLTLCGIMFYIAQNIKTVYIKDGDKITLSHTLKKEPELILSEQGITTMAFDVVDFTGFEGKMGVINISRAFPVVLTCDGVTREIMTTEISVRELLSENDIILSSSDTLSIPKQFYLSPNDVVVVTRINDEYVTETEIIPFETEYKKTPLLRKNRTRVLSSGRDGELVKTIKNTLTDNIVTGMETVEEKVARVPVNANVLIGADVPVSNLDFDVPLDANGNPIKYKSVLRNQICTGYSASKGSKGASGQRLTAGSVAVRSNQIPYGTKLYIKSSDGSFIYGCAVAADTGTGLMQNIIDIDLFYDSYLESCLNGRKYLDVYIL